jgi:RNA polymerase sigma-70 factor (ECF subfamily)
MSYRSAVFSDSTRRRFTEIVAPHLDDAWGLARWLTGAGADAEDVVQEACLRALAALDGAPVERPRAWLLAIVRNAAFTWLAKNRPAAIVLTGEPEMLEAAAAGLDAPPDPEQALIAAADEAALTAAIAALAPIYREVVVMRDISGLSYREIAAAIGAPQGTVMSRLARGRAQLIERLGRRP